jgi:prepilin-type N-terminal cleavage/methylation domain-containing protein
MTARTRRGYSLFELLVVLMILLLLAAAVLPSLAGLRNGPRQRAAADAIRGELAIARSRAMEEGRPYRVAISQDGARIRRAPDDTNFEQQTASNTASASAVSVDYPFDHVTAFRVAYGNVSPPDAVNGWVTVASVQPDGTCLEDWALVQVKEDNIAGIYIQVRGLTSSSRVVNATNATGVPQ